jgi:hypothetical protein
MPLHYIQLTVGNKTYKDKVSTQGCADVAEFRSAIKSKFSPDLDSYAPHHLTLLQPDAKTEIDPETPVDDLKEIPWKPMVVTVDELPIPAPIGRSKKQLTYKGMSTEASCRKYLDALAIEIYFDYDFPKTYKKPTMGDVLAARDGQVGKPKEEAKGLAWWDYKKENGIQLTDIPLPSLLSAQQWDILKSLNRDTTKRIRDAQLPRTSSQKPFIVLPHGKFTETNYVDELKSIAAIIGVVPTEDELIVKDESDLSGSSSSESGSPDKDRKL